MRYPFGFWSALNDINAIFSWSRQGIRNLSDQFPSERRNGVVFPVLGYEFQILKSTRESIIPIALDSMLAAD
jgi:hypothetical protein